MAGKKPPRRNKPWTHGHWVREFNRLVTMRPGSPKTRKKTQAAILTQNLKKAVNSAKSGRINKYLKLPKTNNTPIKSARGFLVKTIIAAKSSKLAVGKLEVLVRFNRQTQALHIQTVNGKYEIRITTAVQQAEFHESLKRMFDPKKRTQETTHLIVEVLKPKEN